MSRKEKAAAVVLTLAMLTPATIIGLVIARNSATIEKPVIAQPLKTALYGVYLGEPLDELKTRQQVTPDSEGAEDLYDVLLSDDFEDLDHSFIRVREGKVKMLCVVLKNWLSGFLQLEKELGAKYELVHSEGELPPLSAFDPNTAPTLIRDYAAEIDGQKIRFHLSFSKLSAYLTIEHDGL